MIATFAPSLDEEWTLASPIPLLPTVTTAILPSDFPDIECLHKRVFDGIIRELKRTFDNVILTNTRAERKWYGGGRKS